MFRHNLHSVYYNLPWVSEGINVYKTVFLLIISQLRFANAMNSLPTVNNLKTHICVEGKNIQRLITALQKIEHIVHNNFIVCRDVYTFIIFPKRGFINITGIKSFCDLKNVIPHFCKMFKVDADHRTELVVDNICAAGSFNQFINLVKLQHVLNSRKKEFTVHFDRKL